jgi:hypothetical protein
MHDLHEFITGRLACLPSLTGQCGNAEFLTGHCGIPVHEAPPLPNKIFIFHYISAV